MREIATECQTSMSYEKRWAYEIKYRLSRDTSSIETCYQFGGDMISLKAALFRNIYGIKHIH